MKAIAFFQLKMHYTYSDMAECNDSSREQQCNYWLARSRIRERGIFYRIKTPCSQAKGRTRHARNRCESPCSVFVPFRTFRRTLSKSAIFDEHTWATPRLHTQPKQQWQPPPEGSPCFVEIPAQNVEKLKTFYSVPIVGMETSTR